jgi:hypothetical protein
MWTSLLINAILSIIIIFILHHLWEYCKTNYTSQKTKNLAEIQASKYKQIAEDIERNSTALVMVNDDLPPNNQQIRTPVPVKIQPSDFLPLDEKEWVHKELNTFIDTL